MNFLWADRSGSLVTADADPGAGTMQRCGGGAAFVAGKQKYKGMDMDAKVEQLLQTITFVERDIELHKNILASVPASQPQELEKVIAEIARLKQRAEELKQEVAACDPQVHAQITCLQQATKAFQEIAARKNFDQVITLDHHRECYIDLADGTRVECLVKACDEAGDWTVITLEGETREYSQAVVAS